MASFTTRVELHGADDDDYKVLHKAMARRGFSREIEGEKGTYHLPTAEYNLEGERSGEEVREMAQEAVKETGKKAMVLVSEATVRYWSGLPRVESD